LWLRLSKALALAHISDSLGLLPVRLTAHRQKKGITCNLKEFNTERRNDLEALNKVPKSMQK